jgi:1,4-alpha-glucan branching enzyme
MMMPSVQKPTTAELPQLAAEPAISSPAPPSLAVPSATNASLNTSSATYPLPPEPSCPWISEYDLYLLKEGKHLHLYNKLGAHLTTNEAGTAGVHFAVWAPNAQFVGVMGDFNGWQQQATPLHNLQHSGYWVGFVPHLQAGAAYKYYLQSAATFFEAEKSDPMAFHAEHRPATASKVWPLDDYTWNDQEWMNYRASMHQKDKPISIYELHLASWMKVPEEGNRWLSYRELAGQLIPYLKQQGYTHVEVLPLAEHPFDGSWGYQITGYFAPTSRFGTPDDFKYLVDQLHQNGLGIIMDWVPAHFPKDAHGLAFFDGTHLYEHDDWRKREHKDWGTNIFNYGRWEVQNFLIANALFWLDKYHIDGLRVDAVASMLYLDYSRKEGEWAPNEYGGRENIEAIYFLRNLNDAIHYYYPDTLTFAEESTAWGGVTKPTAEGGLGFDYKWDMGWMHDTLHFMQRDSIYRKYHLNELTFRGLYMFSEQYCLPLSHDEVVHGKGSLLANMPGDGWQQFANLRALLAYQWLQPGKKLLFMGCDIGQGQEWQADSSVDWHLLELPQHQGVQRLVAALNQLYRNEPALHQRDVDAAGFYLIDGQDHGNAVLSFARRGWQGHDQVVVVCNLTPQTHFDYRVGVPHGGTYSELLNTDAAAFDGSNQVNHEPIEAAPWPYQGQPHSVLLTLPPLGVVVLKCTTPLLAD